MPGLGLLLQAGVEREGVRQDGHALAQRRDVGAGLQREGDDVGDLGELGVAEAARRKRRGADAQARRDHRRTWVVGHGVAVDRDVDLVQQVFGLLAVDHGIPQVDEHEVHVGAARADRDAGRRHIGLRQPLRDEVRTAQDTLQQANKAEQDLIGELKKKGMTFVTEQDGLKLAEFRERVIAEVNKDFPSWKPYIERIAAVK